MNKKIKISRIKGGFLIISCFFSSLGLSDVTLDGSMGSAATLKGPNYQIKEELGSREGGNLFHSFGRFNLNNTESATFSGSAGIKNVIGRVTGGQSSIDGTLRVTIPDANLYLLNPAGVIFGKNAKLDVPGAFHVSTADTLKFYDGVLFNSQETTDNSILTTAEPEAFGFLDENPGNITLTGEKNTVLGVTNGKTLSLVGGDISIEDASLYAPGGQINLVSVGSVGDVRITETGLDTASFEKKGSINIKQDPLVPRVIVGQNRVLANVDTSSNTGGKVFIRGGRLVMENANIWADTTNGNGGGIDIGLTRDLIMKGVPEKPNVDITPESGIAAYTNGEGRAGNIVLEAGGLVKLTYGTVIDSYSSSSGNTGDLTINANAILLEGNDSSAVPKFSTYSSGRGDAGNIEVTTSDKLELSGGAYIETNATVDGNAGAITINTDFLKMYDRASIESMVTDAKSEENNSTLDNTVANVSKNNRGNLTIEAASIELKNGSRILSNSLGNGGQAGNMKISTDDLKILTGSFINISPTKGSGGDLSIEAETILFNGEGQTNTGIINSVLGAGNTGDLTITIHNKLDILNGASIFVSNVGPGNNGDLTINAENANILFSGGEKGIVDNSDITGIRAVALGKGMPGSILINSKNLNIQDGGVIFATITSKGDNSRVIEINSPLITLSGKNSFINSGTLDINLVEGISETGLGVENVGEDTSNGAEIKFTAINKLELRDGASISSFTSTKGNAGDLIIDTGTLVVRDNANINANTTNSGKAGTINISADNILLHNAGINAISYSENISLLEDANKAMSGNVVITAHDTLHMENNAFISVMTGKANSGMINISGEGIVKLSGGSEITTSVAKGKGMGGDISITTPITVLDGSSITANAYKGKGGNITITSSLFKSPLSIITAASELSVDGEVKDKPDTFISGSIAALPEITMEIPTLVSSHCAADSQANASSFVIQSSDTELPEPGDLAPSNFIDHTMSEKHVIQKPNGSVKSFSNLESSNQLSAMTGSCME